MERCHGRQRRRLLAAGYIGLGEAQGLRLEDRLPASQSGLVLDQPAQDAHMLGESMPSCSMRLRSSEFIRTRSRTMSTLPMHTALDGLLGVAKQIGIRRLGSDIKLLRGLARPPIATGQSDPRRAGAAPAEKWHLVMARWSSKLLV